MGKNLVPILNSLNSDSLFLLRRIQNFEFLPLFFGIKYKEGK